MQLPLFRFESYLSAADKERLFLIKAKKKEVN